MRAVKAGSYAHFKCEECGSRFLSDLSFFDMVCGRCEYDEDIALLKAKVDGLKAELEKARADLKALRSRPRPRAGSQSKQCKA